MVEGLHAGVVTHSTASADVNFDGLVVPDLIAFITDNDVAGVDIQQSGGSTNVAEAGSGDTFTVALTAQPASDVTVTLTPDAQVSVNPTTLTFTPANWMIAQVVVVDAIRRLRGRGPAYRYRSRCRRAVLMVRSTH